MISRRIYTSIFFMVILLSSNIIGYDATAQQSEKNKPRIADAETVFVRAIIIGKATDKGERDIFLNDLKYLADKIEYGEEKKPPDALVSQNMPTEPNIIEWYELDKSKVWFTNKTTSKKYSKNGTLNVIFDHIIDIVKDTKGKYPWENSVALHIHIIAHGGNKNGGEPFTYPNGPNDETSDEFINGYKYSYPDDYIAVLVDNLKNKTPADVRILITVDSCYGGGLADASGDIKQDDRVAVIGPSTTCPVEGNTFTKAVADNLFAGYNTGEPNITSADELRKALSSWKLGAVDDHKMFNSGKGKKCITIDGSSCSYANIIIEDAIKSSSSIPIKGRNFISDTEMVIRLTDYNLTSIITLETVITDDNGEFDTIINIPELNGGEYKLSIEPLSEEKDIEEGIERGIDDWKIITIVSNVRDAKIISYEPSSSTSITEGEPLNVSLTIKNIGSIEAEFIVSSIIKRDNMVIAKDNSTILIDPDSTKSIDFAYTLEAGLYTLSLSIIDPITGEIIDEVPSIPITVNTREEIQEEVSEGKPEVPFDIELLDITPPLLMVEDSKINGALVLDITSDIDIPLVIELEAEEAYVNQELLGMPLEVIESRGLLPIINMDIEPIIYNGSGTYIANFTISTAGSMNVAEIPFIVPFKLKHLSPWEVVEMDKETKKLIEEMLSNIEKSWKDKKIGSVNIIIQRRNEVLGELLSIPTFNLHEYLVGDKAELLYIIKNNDGEKKEFTLITKITDEVGNIVDLSYNKVSIEPYEIYNFIVSYNASIADNYKIELFAWKSLDKPIPLMPKLTDSILFTSTTSTSTTKTVPIISTRGSYGWRLVPFGSKEPAGVVVITRIPISSHPNYGGVDEIILIGPKEPKYKITSIPGLNTTNCPEELVIYIHGFMNDPETAKKNFEQFTKVLRSKGYKHPVVGFSWDSDVPGSLEFNAARDIAILNGKALAKFILDYKNKCPNTKIRLVSHSLGAAVVLSAIADLDKKGKKGIIETVDMLGPAVDNEEIQKGTKFADSDIGKAIENVVKSMRVYFSYEDDVFSRYYWIARWDQALGENGIEDPSKKPSNVTIINVDNELSADTDGDGFRDQNRGDNHSGYIGVINKDGNITDDGCVDLVYEHLLKTGKKKCYIKVTWTRVKYSGDDIGNDWWYFYFTVNGQKTDWHSAHNQINNGKEYYANGEVDSGSPAEKIVYIRECECGKKVTLIIGITAYLDETWPAEDDVGSSSKRITVTCGSTSITDIIRVDVKEPGYLYGYYTANMYFTFRIISK